MSFSAIILAGGKSKRMGENKATLKDKIFIRDRVRDLVYDEFNDKIILALENQEAIGIIEAK